jgi:hypothetical protein
MQTGPEVKSFASSLLLLSLMHNFYGIGPVYLRPGRFFFKSCCGMCVSFVCVNSKLLGDVNDLQPLRSVLIYFFPTTWQACR